MLGVVRQHWRWGSSSSDNTGTEGGGGGCCCQDTVGVVDIVAIEMLWGWSTLSPSRCCGGSSLSDDAGDGMVILDGTGDGGHCC